jgi:1,4-dihydroxy-2-naphthoate polyprenyltransferase
LNLRQFLGVVEMRTKLVSLSTLTAATLYALRESGRLDALVLALTLPAVLLVDMGTTAFNSFFDYWRGVDRGKPLREADKVLVTEGVPALAALIVAAVCYLVAVFLGLALAFKTGIWVVPLGLLCLAAGFLYNGGPLPISRTAFGELVAGGFLGSALFLIAYRLQTGTGASRALLASLPGSLFIASILAVNNGCDASEDRLSGRRTLAILLGPRRAAFLPPALDLAAYAATIALAATGVLPGACAFSGAAAALLSLPLYRAMLRRGFSHESKSASMRSILALFLLWSLGLIVGLVAGPSRG